jgi:hypothetical protein
MQVRCSQSKIETSRQCRIVAADEEEASEFSKAQVRKPVLESPPDRCSRPVVT